MKKKHPHIVPPEKSKAAIDKGSVEETAADVPMGEVFPIAGIGVSAGGLARE